MFYYHRPHRDISVWQRRLTACLPFPSPRTSDNYFCSSFNLYRAVDQEIGVLWAFLSEMMGNEMSSLCVSWCFILGSLDVTLFLGSIIHGLS